jgi:tetratricopeptide (TPR) repeat protein
MKLVMFKPQHNSFKLFVTAALLLSGTGMLVNPNATTAAPTATQRIAQSTTDTETLYEQGIEKFREADYQGAIADFTQALKTSQGSRTATLLTKRGDIYYVIGEPQKAIADYQKAAEALEKNNFSVFAKKLFKRVAELQSEINEPAKMTAEIWFQRGKDLGFFSSKVRIAYFNRAIQLKPDYANAYYERAMILGLSDESRAIADLQTAANLYKKRGETAKYENAMSEIADCKKGRCGDTDRSD